MITALGKVEIERALRLLEEIKKAAGEGNRDSAATKTVSLKRLSCSTTPIKVAGRTGRRTMQNTILRFCDL